MSSEELIEFIKREGDNKNFEINGIKCSIIRNSLGVLCGYIDLTEDFPEYGNSYYDLHLYCHGGLNFSQQNGKYWRIGFDCGHSSDIVPKMIELNKIIRISHNILDEKNTYKDMAYVEAEIMYLIEQLDTTKHDIRVNRESKLKVLDE